MANRTYLYSAERLAPWPREEEPYYDSRWAIPFAWFFFYRPSDIYMAKVGYAGSNWHETKLAADKGSAAALFKSRQPLLLETVGGQLSAGAVEAFARTVGRWRGRFLLMDPAEVFGGRCEDETWHAEQFSRILSVLGTEGVSAQEVLAAARTYVGHFDSEPERLQTDVIGYTYWE